MLLCSPGESTAGTSKNNHVSKDWEKISKKQIVQFSKIFWRQRKKGGKRDRNAGKDRTEEGEKGRKEGRKEGKRDRYAKKEIKRGANEGRKGERKEGWRT